MIYPSVISSICEQPQLMSSLSVAVYRCPVNRWMFLVQLLVWISLPTFTRPVAQQQSDVTPETNRFCHSLLVYYTYYHITVTYAKGINQVKYVDAKVLLLIKQ